MLHAAALLIGLFIIALLATQGLSLAFAGVCAVACTLVTLRLFGFGRSPFGSIITVVMQIGARAGAMLRGALQTLRAAASADVTMRPALVQLRTRAGDELSLAMLVNLISATPGAVVVDADTDGILVHVMNEDAEEVADLPSIEARVASALMRGVR